MLNEGGASEGMLSDSHMKFFIALSNLSGLNTWMITILPSGSIFTRLRSSSGVDPRYQFSFGIDVNSGNTEANTSYICLRSSGSHLGTDDEEEPSPFIDDDCPNKKSQYFLLELSL